MPTAYLAFVGDGQSGVEVHLVREGAEASLCGLPRASLSSTALIENVQVCRDCVDWTAKRWTGTFRKLEA
jgi:hypothetical protein